MLTTFVTRFRMYIVYLCRKISKPTIRTMYHKASQCQKVTHEGVTKCANQTENKQEMFVKHWPPARSKWNTCLDLHPSPTCSTWWNKKFWINTFTSPTRCCCKKAIECKELPNVQIRLKINYVISLHQYTKHLHGLCDIGDGTKW